MAWGVQVKGFDSFARDLRRLEPAAARQFNRELQPVTRKIAADASARAPVGPTRRRPSGRKPLHQAIRAGSRRGAPAVIVPNRQAPHAKVHEFGGRHPLFGNRERWFAQPARPYLGPAVDAHRRDVQKALEGALDRALTSTGWR